MRLGNHVAAWIVVWSCAAGVTRADWLDDANARIERDRKADFTIRVVDQSGNPVSGASVSLTETASSFRWGTAVNSAYLASTSDPSNLAIYKQKLTTLFNQGVLENDHKWIQWETPTNKTNAIAATNYLMDRGMTVRGHTMVWQRRASLPSDVVAAYDNGDAATARTRQLNHIASIGAQLYNGRSIGEWDVLNEQNDNHLLTDLINPGAPKEQSPFLVDAFNAARSAAPGARLYMNDYSLLASGNNTNTAAQRSTYDTATYLKAQGAPLGGIGFQGHHASANARTFGPGLVTILDRFTGLGVPLQVTEFDMTGSGWTEQMKADYMREFMIAVFSEKAVVGFNMWGFWDGKHFANSAPLFDINWNLKLSGEVYMDLVFNQWRTKASGQTDGTGTYLTRGFLGDYKVDVTQAGVTQTLTASLDADGRTLVVTVPEPTAMPCLAAAVAVIAGRRRRMKTATKSRLDNSDAGAAGSCSLTGGGHLHGC